LIITQDDAVLIQEAPKDSLDCEPEQEQEQEQEQERERRHRRTLHLLPKTDALVQPVQVCRLRGLGPQHNFAVILKNDH
jgi:hypothetical protein